MKTLKNWTLAAQHADHVELLVDERHRFCLYVLENDLFRVLIKREGELALDRTWSIAPQEDVPWEGARSAQRRRLQPAGLSAAPGGRSAGGQHAASARNGASAAVAGMGVLQRRRRVAAAGGGPADQRLPAQCARRRRGALPAPFRR